MLHFIQEPRVDFGQRMDLFRCHARSKRFAKREDAARGRVLNLFLEIGDRKITILLRGESLRAHIEHTDCLLQDFFKIAADRHHFADTLHFGADSRRCSFKFGHVPAWHLEHEIIERGLKAGGSLACD